MTCFFIHIVKGEIFENSLGSNSERGKFLLKTIVVGGVGSCKPCGRFFVDWNFSEGGVVFCNKLTLTNLQRFTLKCNNYDKNNFVRH